MRHAIGDQLLDDGEASGFDGRTPLSR